MKGKEEEELGGTKKIKRKKREGKTPPGELSSGRLTRAIAKKRHEGKKDKNGAPPS